SAYEGFGRPYIEAMACGTPVVATPNPGALEVLEGGRYGVIVSPAGLEEIGGLENLKAFRQVTMAVLPREGERLVLIDEAPDGASLKEPQMTTWSVRSVMHIVGVQAGSVGTRVIVERLPEQPGSN
ncbi:MAG: hypothetical protein C4289_11280, partial [Chloroflexota bacterium]